MARYRKRRVIARHAMLLSIFPFGLMVSTYALFSQNLSLNAATSSVSYISNQSLMMTYTKTQTSTSPYTYTIGATIKNNAAKATTIWQLTFTVPSDTASISCPATVKCSLNGTSLTVLSSTNGALAIGGSTLVTFSFATATNAYTLQDVTTYANYTATYATLSGLTVNTAVGTRIKNGSNYSWPLSVTVTNSTGQPIKGWRVTISPFSTSYSISGLPTGITKSGTTTLILTSTIPLATGDSYQFSSTVSTGRTSSWSISSATVQGTS